MEKERISNRDEMEKQYADMMKRQWMIFDALGNDFVNLGLIHIKREMVSVLKTNFRNGKQEYAEGVELPYLEMCEKSMAQTVADAEKHSLMEKMKLDKIVAELSKQSEYSFVFEACMETKIHTCQIKYVNLNDGEHILMAFRFVDDVVSKEKEKNIENEKRNADELRKERMFLEVLCQDYTSVYYFDLNQDTLEILKMDASANSMDMFDIKLRKKLDYSTEMKKYCAAYVVENSQEEFLKVMSHDFLAQKLADADRFIYRYQSNPNKAGHQYFEVQAVRIENKQFDNTAILAFRQIDDIVAEEKKHQEELQAKMVAEERARTLEAERQAAVCANEMKSRFLSSISHDIRTPINGIQGMLRIADTYANDLKKQNECREKLWIASNYLVSLVNNVLDMNRLESQSVMLSEQPFNMIDLLMSVTAMTDIQMKEQGLHSIVDWKPGYINHRYLIGSAEGLSRILMNLNSNAIKYNKKGGTVYCRCLEKECDGDVAWFEIINSDTGVGMDAEFLKYAFDPYSQKNNTSLNSMHGVGLGLSIVKQTVELMGGTLQVESKIGEGTKYTIMLPFKIDKNPQIKKTSFEQISLKGVKALLVEDNNLNMEIAKFCLEQEDVKVFTAMDGQEAVTMFEQSEIGFFDLILMDVMMPVMDGLEAAKSIRSSNRPDGLTIPIIAMSANAFEQDIEKSMEAGMNAHLIKPLDLKKVTDTMKKFLADKIVKKE